MAPKRVAIRVSEGVAASVHGQSEVYLLRIEAVEPQRNGIVVNLANICLASYYLSECFDVGIPRAMKVWIKCVLVKFLGS